MKFPTLISAHAPGCLYRGLRGACAVILCVMLLLGACSQDPDHEPKPIPGSPTAVGDGKDSDASPDSPDAPTDADTSTPDDGQPEGDAGSEDAEPPADEAPRGDGSYADPYNVAYILQDGGTGWPDVWVEGYIVGYYASGGFPAAARCGAWSPTDAAYQDGNLLLADSPAESRAVRMMPVMLSGPYAAQYGLRSNPSKVGCHIRIRCAIGPLARPALSQPGATIPAALNLTALIELLD